MSSSPYRTAARKQPRSSLAERELAELRKLFAIGLAMFAGIMVSFVVELLR